MAQFSSILKVLVSFQLMFLQVTEISSATKIEPVGDVPFLVQIWHKHMFICGGTIVSQRHIVTAASCVNMVGDPKDVQHPLAVVEGASKVGSDGVKHKVSRITIHPDNVHYTSLNNIAVLELETCLTICPDEIPPPCTKPINVGDEVQTFGWEYHDETSSSELQSVRVRVIDNAECEYKYDELDFNKKSAFCGEAPGNDKCYANSGGPALVNGQFCGIESITLNACSYGEYQRIYVDVLKLQSFLNDALTL